MPTPAIVAEGLERSFGEFRAVRGVNLKVSQGEIYGFLGPNGAGKSTTVRMLCTLLRPTGGKARVAGYDVASETAQVRLRIGVALQEAGLDHSQTGHELLLMQGRLYGLKGAELTARIDDILEMVNLGEAIERRVGTYSGGMARRLDLAMALVHNPEVLFLDEPTTGLDPTSRIGVWQEVRRLNEEMGMTIFLTTQYLEEADELAHRVGIIDKGQIVAEGTPAELKSSIGTDVIVVRVDGPAEVATKVLRSVPGADEVTAHGQEISVRTVKGAATISPVAVALSNNNVAVSQLTLRTPTLDDVFLEMTGARIGGR